MAGAAGCSQTGISRRISPRFPEKSVVELSLDGDWKILPDDPAPANGYLPETDDEKWDAVPVPSNWYPVHGEHSGTVWFRKHFTFPADWSGDMLTLCFDGVDYAADVWLNGRYLGHHEGYFAPFRFMVTDAARPGEKNLLAVRVNSPYEMPGPVWSLKKRLIKGIFNHHDTRPGGAWSVRGQEKNTGGIWGPVWLRRTSSAALESFRITPEVNLTDGKAGAQIAVVMNCPLPRKIPVNCRLRLSPHEFIPSPDEPGEIVLSEERTLVPGKNTLLFRIPPKRFRLWNTWDHGQPWRYDLEIALFRDNRLMDRQTGIFGFRKVTCDPETLIWTLNGKRIFLRGTNYISTQWLSEMTPEKYAHDLRLMTRANINAVRVHAHVEAAGFYRACDAAGMLVWQDFPLQWGYSDTPAFADEAGRQALEMADMLYNHPSVIAWCGHNEPPWSAEWMVYKYPEYDPRQNRRLDRKLYEILKTADPTRYVHEASVTEEHPWLGWYSGSWCDFQKPAKYPLITEYGAQALPGMDTLRTIFPPDRLWPDSEEDRALWEYHNFQFHEMFDIAGVSKGRNINEFIENTQKYQARLVQYAAESYRRQRFRPVSGIFQFLFSENWPSVNWGIMDYRREPKPGYYALQTAYQPLLPCVEYSKDRWQAGENVFVRLWVINDLHKNFRNMRLRYVLTQQDGSFHQQGENRLDIRPDSAEMVQSLEWKGLPPGEFVLVLRLEDANGGLLAWNNWQFDVEAGR